MNKENYDKVVAEALNVLREGGVILYPTDTVWGLGCDATNPSAVAKVYGIKKRSDSKSLVLLASDLDMVARFVERIPDIAIDLVEDADVEHPVVDDQKENRPLDKGPVESLDTLLDKGRFVVQVFQ